MVETLLLIGLIVVALAGVGLTLVKLPGTWLILAAAAGYSWYFDWTRPTWKALLVLFVLAAIGEVIELLAGVASVQRAGASRRASWWALGGGIVGMFLFTIPLPLIGTVIGGVIGCFLGAMIGELSIRGDVRHSARVGLFAAVGHIVGTIFKTMISLVMAAIAVLAAVLEI
ncbi:MAG: DUF456 domain-containing protein [Planctomycetes bacterium]|nr:DUF456 domain-containing protein [Planctomycetota bacterium]